MPMSNANCISSKGAATLSNPASGPARGASDTATALQRPQRARRVFDAAGMGCIVAAKVYRNSLRGRGKECI